MLTNKMKHYHAALEEKILYGTHFLTHSLRWKIIQSEKNNKDFSSWHKRKLSLEGLKGFVEFQKGTKNCHKGA